MEQHEKELEIVKVDENEQETAIVEVITPKEVVFTKKVEEFLTVAGESILAFFRKVKATFPLWWVEVAVIGILLMVFVLLYLVRVSMKLSRFQKRYRIFMRGKDAVSLEKAFAQKFLEVDRLSEVTKNQYIELNKIKDIPREQALRGRDSHNSKLS